MAKKDVSGKPKLGSIPYEALVAVAGVREYGTSKYGNDPNGWMEVESKDFVEAAIRHLYKHLHESDTDDESGLQHLAHAACSILLAIPNYNEEQWMESSGMNKSLDSFNQHKKEYGDYDCGLPDCEWCPFSEYNWKTGEFKPIYRPKPMPKDIRTIIDKWDNIDQSRIRTYTTKDFPNLKKTKSEWDQDDDSEEAQPNEALKKLFEDYNKTPIKDRCHLDCDICNGKDNDGGAGS